MKKTSEFPYLFSIVLLGVSFFSVSSAKGQKTETGTAVYYADYLHGQSTALGEIYNKYELTCAHKSYPLGSLLRVTRLDNNQSVTVRVNDRVHAKGVLLDLSWSAAQQIDLVSAGKAKVKAELIGYSATNPHNPNKPTGDQYKYAGNPAFSETNKEFTARGVETSQVASKKEGDQFDPNEVKMFPHGQTGYAIQIASYTNIGNAQRYVIGLQHKGMKHLYLKPDRSTALYRVIVAPFSEKLNAINYLMDMKKQFDLEGLVVSLDQ